jgi:hypothetical protein
MLLKHLPEICHLLNRFNDAEDSALAYKEVLNGSPLSLKDVRWLFDRLEQKGYLRCSGRDIWNEPKGYQLLRRTETITLYDLMVCAGMGDIFSPTAKLDSTGGKKLSVAATNMKNELMKIYVKEMVPV